MKYSLEKIVRKTDTYGLSKCTELIELMSLMLEEDPMKRIRPDDVLRHKFC